MLPGRSDIAGHLSATVYFRAFSNGVHPGGRHGLEEVEQLAPTPGQWSQRFPARQLFQRLLVGSFISLDQSLAQSSPDRVAARPLGTLEIAGFLVGSLHQLADVEVGFAPLQEGLQLVLEERNKTPQNAT